MGTTPSKGGPDVAAFYSTAASKSSSRSLKADTGYNNAVCPEILDLNFLFYVEKGVFDKQG